MVVTRNPLNLLVHIRQPESHFAFFFTTYGVLHKLLAVSNCLYVEK